MAVTILGDQFIHGFTPATAPTGLTGFVARQGEFRREPQVYVAATDGSGAAEAVAASKIANRKISATFTGYILSTFNPKTAAATGVISATVDGVAKNFIVKRIVVPRNKGQLAEVTIEAEHFPLVSI